MAEYIEREEAQKVARKYGLSNGYVIGTHSGLADLIEYKISNIPAADVAPVRHGKWEYDPNGMDWGLGAWVCSVCGCKNDNLGMSERINPYLFSGSNFCPNCGAVMDLEDKHGT